MVLGDWYVIPICSVDYKGRREVEQGRNLGDWYVIPISSVDYKGRREGEQGRNF